MIKGIHGMFYTPKADEVRAVLRDVLELDHIDSGGGWLIFAVPKAELGVHPADAPRHDMSFYCDDIDTTVATLKDRGVESTPIKEAEWGRVTTLKLPGGLDVGLYEPRHKQP